MDLVIELIKVWKQQKKVGSITVNFFKGGITSVKVEETLKIDKK